MFIFLREYMLYTRVPIFAKRRRDAFILNTTVSHYMLYENIEPYHR